MDRHDLLEDIMNAFQNNVENYQKSSGAITYQFFPKYKGTEDIEHLVSMQADLEYQSYIVAFRLTVHKNLMEVNNILDCFIRFDKQRQLYYPLEYVLDYLNHNTLIPLVIPCISNALTMTQCFEILSYEVTKICDEIEDMSFHKIQQNELEMIIKNEIYDDQIPEGLDDEDYQFIHDYYIENIMFTYFVDDAYIYFLLGDYETSLKKYAKQKKITHYEDIIVELMKNSESRDSFLPYTICYQLKNIYKIGVSKFDKKEMLVYGLSMIVHSCLWFVFYYILSKITYYFIKSDTLYFIGNQAEEIFNCIFYAIWTSMISSYLTRMKVYYYLFRNEYNDYKERQLMIESPRQQRFMFKFFLVIVVSGYLMLFCDVRNNVSFYENGFIDYTEFFSMTGASYSYSEIKRIYYKENEDNIFGDKVDPSLIIEMKDGEIIDLWEFDQDEYIEKEIMPFLKLKNVKIEEKKK